MSEVVGKIHENDNKNYKFKMHSFRGVNKGFFVDSDKGMHLGIDVEKYFDLYKITEDEYIKLCMTMKLAAEGVQELP